MTAWGVKYRKKEAYYSVDIATGFQLEAGMTPEYGGW